ncbi:acrosin-binding protein-like [Polypterus senegalus]|uniref:acrosin-binding protein-like n=1 Tax=Polypterus senegalus TaxID=55291 RepID=UPI0019648EA0|nr:acrosin-binding protein-like [Polypterus senegalus]
MKYGCENQMIQELDNLENNNLIPTGPICTTVKNQPIFPNFCSFAKYRCKNRVYFDMRVPCPDDPIELFKSVPRVSDALTSQTDDLILSTKSIGTSEDETNDPNWSESMEFTATEQNFPEPEDVVTPPLSASGLNNQMFDSESSKSESYNPYSSDETNVAEGETNVAESETNVAESETNVAADEKNVAAEETSVAVDETNMDASSELERPSLEFGGHPRQQLGRLLVPAQNPSNPDYNLLKNHNIQPQNNLQGSLPLHLLTDEAAEAEAAAAGNALSIQEDDKATDPTRYTSLIQPAHNPHIPNPMKGDFADLLKRINQPGVGTLHDKITKAVNEGNMDDVKKLSKQLYQVLMKTNGAH